MKKKLNIKHALTKNKGIIIILIVLFTNCVGDGMSSVFLPAIVNSFDGKSEWLGLVIGIQSFLGVILFLPQANLIKYFGEKTCINIGMFINIVAHLFYLVPNKMLLSLGKFLEGMADRLMNSATSKLIYDETDYKNNRGRIRATVDGISNVGIIIGPLIAAALLGFSLRVPIIFTIIILLIGFVCSLMFSDKKDTNINGESGNSILEKFYISHLKKYWKNKSIVLITIPSLLFSSLDIFYDMILSLYLINYVRVSYSQIGVMWGIITILSLILQVPSGVLADKNKKLALGICFTLNLVGFLILIIQKSNPILSILAVIIINSGCVIYTTSMSALFGDFTTTENRLSESESYRMIREIGSGFFAIILTYLFDRVALLTILFIGISVLLGTLLTYVVYVRFNKKQL